MTPDRRGFGLYVHWPFCTAKCPYCDFNSHVHRKVDHFRWTEAYLREIERTRSISGGRVLDSIFFGGGTPSLMPPKTVESIISAARSAWSPSNQLEITLEANPTSVEASRFEGYAHAGVNRLSVGVQSLRDDDLKRLGRLHTAKQAVAAVETAAKFFERVSVDLIYARQDQTISDWEAELQEALDLGTDHVSAYQLTIEPGTAFGDRLAAGGLNGLPDEDLSADMYFVTQEILAGAGLPAYEISNHARSGYECRHNLIYWSSGDWVGIGPGAHGRLTLAKQRVATETHLAPLGWLKAVETSGSGESSSTILSTTDQENEMVMMGLRLSHGIPEKNFKKSNNINSLVDIGMLEVSGGMVRATSAGRPVLNAIIRELLL